MSHGAPTKRCDNCCDKFDVTLSEKDERKFCSQQCFSESQKDRVSVNCDECDSSFEVVRSTFDRQNRFFCDNECRSDGMSGKGNPSYGATNKVSVICDTCGEKFERVESHAERGSRNFCSRDCINFEGDKNPFYDRVHSEKVKNNMPSGSDHWNYGRNRPEHAKLMSDLHSGEGNPMYGVRGEDAPSWDGGNYRENQTWRYTAEWFDTREAVLKRDNHQCSECDLSESLHVHHINPVSDGGKKFDTENLITLCKEHHYERHKK
jgi:hypothetical protein